MKTYYRLALGCIVLMLVQATGNRVFAQRFFNNPVSQYYRNGFLWNPALAGAEGTRLYGLLNKSWSGFEGAPQQISLSADMRFAEKMGAGLQLTSDKSNIFRRYSGAFSYAYAISTGEKSSLRLGGSLSFYNERLDGDALTYEGQFDPSGKQLNEEAINFNGDFGVAYVSEDGFSLGATAYNLGAYTQQKEERSADLAIAQAVASYRFNLENERVNIRPLLAYKMFYDHTNIFTAATQVEYEGAFHAGLYWQSTGNVMGGVGLMFKDAEVNFFYSGRNKYQVNQQYEIGLKYTIR